MSSLSGPDYLAILNLSAETSELDDPEGQVAHFMQGVRRLGSFDTLYLQPVDWREGHLAFRSGYTQGLDEGMDEKANGMIDELGAGSGRDPLADALWEHRGTTKLRRELFDDSLWYSDPSTQVFCNLLGLDDFVGKVFSLRLGYGVIYAMQLVGGTPYTEFHRDFLDACTRAFQWLFRQLETSGQLRLLPKGLPGRCDRVLWLSMRGYSEKKMAAELGLSPRTVHKYVEEIFRFYKVSSRAELIARLNSAT